MENLNKIKSEILNKVKNARDRNTYDTIKSEIFGKKELLQSFLKKLEAQIKAKEKNTLQNLTH